MNQDGMYYEITQEYLELKKKKRELTRERNNINAKLEIIEDILVALDDILSKHGSHIYEHFREGDPQPEKNETEGSEASDG